MRIVTSWTLLCHLISNINHCRILFCSIVKIVFFHIQSSAVYTNLGALQVLGSPSFLCLLGSHMFFNLKEAASTEEDGHISTARQGTVFSSVSNLRFGIPTHCDPPTGVFFFFIHINLPRCDVIFLHDHIRIFNGDLCWRINKQG